jgi:hypothetical protein
LSDPIEAYLREMALVHSSQGGVDETSYYPALNKLLNEIGQTLTPKVHCIMGLRNLGAGLPDGGLFTVDQISGGHSNSDLSRQIPARGAVEAKPVSEDVRAIAVSQQARDYLARYGKLLVTSYREFLLVARAPDGTPRLLERFSFAPDEAAFWRQAEAPRRTSRVLRPAFEEYIKRVITYGGKITNPRDLASILAAHAREARRRLDFAPPEALEPVKNELSEALGVQFTGEKGRNFFLSTFVQALFYGLFSAWVLSTEGSLPSQSASRFEWKMASWSLNIPMISPLFSGITMPNRLGPLNLAEVLDWSEEALNTVDPVPFFRGFHAAHAVQYFYEPFLEAFDPELRKELGVWYTPVEIVDYMVARVDQALVSSLGIEDGLADSRVIVLDPCCGTGSYLLSILRKIRSRLTAKYGEALAGAHLKQAAIERLFGFEILPAPFVVSHLQIGLFLKLAGAGMDPQRGERAGVFLTNSLTGWSPADGPQTRLTGYFDLEREREAATDVKRVKRVLVVIGNPPYNGFAGVSPAEEQGLVEPYKEGLLSEWGFRKYNLDDLYVRFYRLAERRIVDQTGEGIVCYISNYSFVGHPSFVVMRRRFLNEFQEIWIDNLNGDSRENKKVTPLGEPDPSVFSTDQDREGIRVGTAVGLLIRKATAPMASEVRYRELWGKEKRRELLASAYDPTLPDKYADSHPVAGNRFTFRASSGSAEYDSWPSLADLSGVPPLSGPQEGREKAFLVTDVDRAKLGVIRAYLDPNKTDEEIQTLDPRLMKPASRFHPNEARRRILTAGIRFDERRVVPYTARPMDLQLAYLDPALHPVFYWPRPELIALKEATGTPFIVSRDTAHAFPEGVPLCYTNWIADYHSLSVASKLFPFLLGPASGPEARSHRQTTLSGSSRREERRANLSTRSRDYLRRLGLEDPDTDAAIGSLLWFHTIAIAFSPTYLLGNETGVRQGWPRVPLPKTASSLRRSAELGENLSHLLELSTRVPAVTSGTLRRELAPIGVLTKAAGGPINQAGGDLRMTASWGHGTTVVMPGRGRIAVRRYTPSEIQAFRDGSSSIGLTDSEALECLGHTTLDVYLNESTYWSNIPLRVWEFIIGGSQVIKKWLSYRDFSVLGRSLEPSEATRVTDMARRLATIRLLEPRLDSNFEEIRTHCYAWTVAGMQGPTN